MSDSNFFEQVGIAAEQLRMAANAAQQMDELAQTGGHPNNTLEKHIATIIRSLMTLLEARVHTP